MITHVFVLLFLAGIYVRPGELFPALAEVPIMDILAGAGLLVGAISLALKPRGFWNQPQDFFFLGYYLIIVASNPLNGFMTGGVAALTNFSTVAVTYLLLRMGASTPQQIRRVTQLLTVLTLFLAVNGLMQVYLGAGIGGVQAFETREGARIQGTGIFSDANDLGMAMVTVIPFVLSVVLGRTGPFVRLLNALMLGILLLACYYTNSRGTIIGVGVVFSIFAFRRFGLFTAASLSAMGLAAILAFGPSRMSQVGSQDASSQGRIQAWAAAIVMFEGSPFWGVGYGGFINHHERAAHNSFMHALGELGLIGATMFIGMFYWYFVGLRGLLAKETAEAQPRAGPATSRPLAFMAPGPMGLSFAAPVTVPDRRLPLTPPGASKAEKPSGQREFNRRLALDLSDCGIGMLTCVMFLSRQYTVSLFIPLALSACLASAETTARRARPSGAKDPQGGMGTAVHLAVVSGITLGLIATFWVGIKVLVRY